MAYGILRFSKVKGASGGAGAYLHNERKKEHSNTNPDINFDLSKTNYSHGIYDESKTYNQRCEERIQQGYTGKRAVRKDAVKMLEFLVAPSDNSLDLDTSKAFLKDSYEWLCDRFGRENVIADTVHLDETTPHMHVVIVPLTKDGRLSAKDFTGTAVKLQKMQDDFFEKVSSKYGLKRGEKADLEDPNREIKRHVTMKKYKERDLAEVEREIQDAKTDLSKYQDLRVKERAKLDKTVSEAVEVEIRLDKAQSGLRQVKDTKDALEGDIERLRGTISKTERDLDSLNEQKASVNKELDSLYLQREDLLQQQREVEALKEKKAALEKECAELLELPTEWEVTKAYEKMEQHFEDMKELLTAQEQDAYHSLDITPLQASLDKAVREKKIASTGFKGVQVSSRANEGFINLLADLIRLMIDYIRKKTSPRSIEEVRQRVDNYHNRSHQER